MSHIQWQIHITCEKCGKYDYECSQMHACNVVILKLFENKMKK